MPEVQDRLQHYLSGAGVLEIRDHRHGEELVVIAPQFWLGGDVLLERVERHRKVGSQR